MGSQGTGKGFSGDLVLDAGALIALEGGDEHTAGMLASAVDLSTRIVIPATALARAWRGGPRSASVARAIESAEIDSLDEERAKEVGVRLSQRGTADIADAHAVCCAVERRAAIATSDQDDLRALAGPRESLVLIPV